MDPENEIVADATPETGAEGAQTATPGAPPADNPAWDAFKSKLPEQFYELIKPTLAEQDKSVQDLLAKTRSEYGWAKELQDAGHTPEYLSNAAKYAQMLDSDPLATYNQIGAFLRQNGLLQEDAAKAQTTDEVKLGDEGQEPNEDPRVAALEQQMQAFQQMQEQAAQAEAARQAEVQLEAEISQMRKAHPEFTDEDENEILSRQAFKVQQAAASGGKIPPMEESAQEYIALRNRIMSAPRPGAQAPRLLPTSGGVQSASANQKSPSELSKNETIDLVSQYISSAGK